MTQGRDQSQGAALRQELAELIEANEKATGWGAAVGARSERIKAIEGLLRRTPEITPAAKTPVSSPQSDEGTPSSDAQPQFAKIKHRGVYIERQSQADGGYKYICHTGILKFLPDLYPTQAAAIEAVDAAMASKSPPSLGEGELLREALEAAFRRFGGIPAIARSEGGAKKIIDIVLAEVAALTPAQRDQGSELTTSREDETPVRCETTAQDAWRPIESAPRDRRDCLIVDTSAVEPTATLAHWTGSYWACCEAHTYCEEIVMHFGIMDPTHWMPLPAPPAPAGDASSRCDTGSKVK